MLGLKTFERGGGGCNHDTQQLDYLHWVEPFSSFLLNPFLLKTFSSKRLQQLFFPHTERPSYKPI
jgi:hypothetical protein